MLDMALKDIERVLYFEQYIVIEPGLTPLEAKQLLTEEEYLRAQDEYGEDSFTAQIGAEAIRELLMQLNLEKEAEQLRKEIAEVDVGTEAEEARQAPEARRSVHAVRATSRNG